MAQHMQTKVGNNNNHPHEQKVPLFNELFYDQRIQINIQVVCTLVSLFLDTV